MDTKLEDTMVHQIERNLSNHMSENLFLAGRTVENGNRPADNNHLYMREVNENAIDQAVNGTECGYPLVSNDYISSTTGISRAEYIRQAREACLRQLSTIQLYSKPYDINYMETPEAKAAPEEQLTQKDAKVMQLFRKDEEAAKSKGIAITSDHELFSYRSIVLRSVCAILLFISVFLIDKFNIEIGNITHKVIQEYVTGNDALKQLENLLVIWLK